MLRCALLATAALAAIPGVSAAQSPSQVVPSTRADQMPAGARTISDNAPKAKPRSAAPAFRPFVLKEVEVSGSTLPSEQITAAYTPFLGQTMDGPKIQALSDAIAANYGDADIALYTVVIPHQDLAAGRLKVNILEGRVADIQIEKTNAGKAAKLVAALAHPLTQETPLRRTTLQRKISLMRDIPGVSVGMDLLNGEADDSVTLKLDPDLRPFQVAVGVNNRGTTFLGKTQVQGDLYLNSFLRGGDQTRFTVAAPTKDDLFLFGSVAHSTPIGSDGDTLLFNATYLRTEPATTALVGRATSIGVQYTRPLIRSFTRDLYVTLGVDGLNSDNALFGRQFSDDRTRAARVAVAYSVTKPRNVLFVVGSISRGLDTLGARTLSPAFTDLEFTKVNVRVGYNMAVGERGVLRLRAAGQASDDILPGSEQLSLGGPDFGRAYESSIVSGDTGYAGSAEFAYRPGGLPEIISGSEAYGFVDGGGVRYKPRDIFAGADYSLGSVGAGVRVNFRRATVELEGARGLGSDTAFLDDHDWRGVISIRTLF